MHNTRKKKAGKLQGETTMTNYKKRLLAASLALAAATLTSTAFASSAFAQCVDCMAGHRDSFTEGLVVTPHANPGGGAVPSQAARNAHAEMRGHSGHSTVKDRPHR
jgi:hypothetical protein